MKAFRTISAVLLALLVLSSSTSFMVGLHFCMGKVQHVSLLGKADSCQKEKALQVCHKHMKPACCQDETFFHKGDDFKATAQHIHIVAPASITCELPLVLISEIIPAAEISRTQSHCYDPPLRSTDLNISLQVFLI